MKKFWFSALAGLFLSLVACSNSSGGGASNVPQTVQSGKWRVAFFSDDGKDETAHFTGWSFEFLASGAATATKSGAVQNGKWQTGIDDSTDKFDLDFGQNDPWENLTEDWRIVEMSASKIRLEHISGGNGGTDVLTFEPF